MMPILAICAALMHAPPVHAQTAATPSSQQPDAATFVEWVNLHNAYSPSMAPRAKISNRAPTKAQASHHVPAPLPSPALLLENLLQPR